VTAYQYPLPFYKANQTGSGAINRDRLLELLSQDLDFHDQDSSYASHNFHSFPAKFPPQLPRKFITVLTNPGDTVLDPMMGSSTTILEAFLAGRRGIGFDIDPLALLISQVKVVPLDPEAVELTGRDILKKANDTLQDQWGELKRSLKSRWNTKTQEFIDYWFAPETQLELLALITQIEKLADEKLRAFFELVFSAIIITKSGGVSLAFDLAHTRPHRVKVVISQTGDILLGEDLAKNPSPRIKILTKTLRSPLAEFEKRFQQNLKSLSRADFGPIPPEIRFGNAQALPLDNAAVDLIVTSPPYASNAIDYMRAHKFSLVWLGHSIDELTQKRKEYIGGEVVTAVEFEDLPAYTAGVVAGISKLDSKRGLVLHRYYSEMTRTLKEMFRVLRPGKVAIVVVGSSMMRGQDTETHTCLADIGRAIGFEVPKVGVRHLDRNRRMLPAGAKLDLDSQIQQRMHEEYVIGFYKP
jgi:DNA modification methylase